MLRIILYLFISIISYGSLFAQKKTNEQLFAEAKNGADSVRLNASYQIAKKYLRITLDTAEQFANISAILAKKLNNRLIEAESYALLGAVQKNRGQFEESIKFHLKALGIKEKLADDYGMSITLNDLGILYKNMQRYDEALLYYKRSLEYSKKAQKLKSIALTTSNIGTIFSAKNKYDSAEFYYNMALPIAKKSEDSNAIVVVLSNLGEVYGFNKNPRKALSYFYECLPIDKALDDKYGLILDYLNIGGSLMKLKQFEQAKPYLDSAYNLSVKEEFAKEQLNALNSLKTYYTAVNDFEKADEYVAKYDALDDSLMNEKIQKNVSELNTKYETAKKQQQIEQQQFDLVKKQYWIYGSLGLLLLTILLAYSYYRRNKLTQEKKLQEEVIKQQDIATKAVIAAEENERRRIAADLHDGVGQTMSAAKMNLSAFEGELIFKDELQKTGFEKIIALIDESCKEVRSVSHQMMPNALLKSGLASAVREFIDKIDARVLKVNLHTEGLNERLDSNVETVLYRVIQECVNNVIKHSGANSLDISLLKDSDGIAATIEDNGRGFAVRDKEKSEGIGLKNIRSRIQFLKGTVDFDSSPGNGTLVAIHVPLV